MGGLHWLNPNKPSYVWSIGYGITTQEEFIHRLKTAFPDGDAIIVDIRKQGSGSRNAGSWANWGHPCMGKTVAKSGNHYESYPEFVNKHGNTIKGLVLYEMELHNGPKRCHLDELANRIRTDPETKYCLMCCERMPFAGKYCPKKGELGWSSWTGKENCHRIVLARNIKYRMAGDYNLEWFTKHLYAE